MRTIASLETKLAVGLSERLKAESIPIEIHTATQDSGLDFSEILVEDSDYDRACDAAEAWQAEQDAEAAKRSKRHCPKCGSGLLDYVWLDNLTPSAKCKHCGCEFLP
jgi:Zn finger protein HypA/HybF involved in hydrogenase expression